MKTKVLKIINTKMAEKAFKDYVKVKIEIAPLEKKAESLSAKVKDFLRTQPEMKAVLAGISVSLSETCGEHFRFVEARKALSSEILEALSPYITKSTSARINVPWKIVNSLSWASRKKA